MAFYVNNVISPVGDAVSDAAAALRLAQQRLAQQTQADNLKAQRDYQLAVLALQQNTAYNTAAVKAQAAAQAAVAQAQASAPPPVVVQAPTPAPAPLQPSFLTAPAPTAPAKSSPLLPIAAGVLGLGLVFLIIRRRSAAR